MKLYLTTGFPWCSYLLEGGYRRRLRCEWKKSKNYIYRNVASFSVMKKKKISHAIETLIYVYGIRVWGIINVLFSSLIWLLEFFYTILRLVVRIKSNLGKKAEVQYCIGWMYTLSSGRRVMFGFVIRKLWVSYRTSWVFLRFNVYVYIRM